MKKDKLLDSVHKNAQTGLYTIPKLMERTENERFRAELQTEEAAYRNIYQTAQTLGRGRADKDLSAFAKLRTNAMIKAETFTNKSASKMAQMLIMGSTAGAIEMRKELRKHPNAPAETKQLAETLLTATEDHVNSLKQFL